jgi:hypothetical protein
MEERPNYYVLLDLDPKIEDAAVIAKAIRDKKRRWSTESAQGSANARRKARTYLDKIGEIERVMGDKESRREEAADARRRIKEAQRASFVQLDQMIDVLPAGSTCTSDDVAKLVKGLSGRLSEQIVTTRLRERGITIEAAGNAGPASTGSATPCLDSTRMAQLRPNLELLSVKDLYDFLAMNPNSSTRSLKEHADQMSRKLITDGGSDPLSNAKKELCGSCMAIFGSDAEKQKYDNALAFEAMEGLRGTIDLAGSKNSYLTIEQQDVLLQQARQRRVSPADARAFLEKIARERRWGIQGVTKLPSEELRQCGNCLALAKSPKASHCNECGHSLTIECPRCSNVVPTEDAACVKCGFPIGDWSWIKVEVDKADKLIRDLHVDEAAKQLKTLLHRWPGWKAVQSRLEDTERHIKERQKERTKLADLVRRNKFLEAQGEAERFRRKWGKEDISTQTSAIADGIARARKAFDEGEHRRLEGKSEQAVALYRSALTICADYDAAHKAMALIPPLAPKNLVVIAEGRGFQIRWESGDKTVDGYAVVRKALSAPTDAKDGMHRLAFSDVTGTDPDVQEGVPWHYAVFSRRDGIFSTSAARSGPHVRVAPVHQLSALAGDGQIKITWTMPNGAVGVEVWRRQGSAPDRPGLGTQLPTSRDSLHDLGLPNDAAVGYLVVPLFEDPRRPGRRIHGPGTSCVATPTTPPPPVTDLRSGREHGGVRLTWSPPTPQAQVQVRQLKTAPNLQVGTVLTKEQADAWGAPVLAATKGLARVRMPSMVEYWFVPLTVKATIAVVGKPISVALVDGLQELAVDHDGRDVHLRWEWPSGATQVAVCHSYDHYPTTPNDRDAIRQDVTLDQYKREGMFTMRQVERRPHYLALFAVTPDGRLHSESLTRLVPMGQSREVRYRIVSSKNVFARFIRGARQRQLEMNGFGHLPETVLVAKPRVVPTGPDDGEKLMHLPEMELAGTYRVPIPTILANSGNVAKLFFINARDVDEIRLISGPLHELKL